jgi:hypothetical protein
MLNSWLKKYSLRNLCTLCGEKLKSNVLAEDQFSHWHPLRQIKKPTSSFIQSPRFGSIEKVENPDFFKQKSLIFSSPIFLRGS